MEDIKDVSKNIQAALSEFASGPMSEVKDLTKQVRDNFLEANSAANIEITGADTLAKMSASLTGIKTGYEAVDNTLISLHTNLNGITDTTELGMEALAQQESIQQRIEKGKADEAKLTDDIAEQQRLVLMAEQARAATPFESTEYKEYTEQIEEANRAIIEQQGHITGLQAQQAGLKSIHDGYLATIIEEVNAGKSINEITSTRRKLYSNNLELSAAQVDLINLQQKELDRLGPGLDDYIKKWGAANDAVMTSFDSIADGISDTLGSLPLVGGLLKAQVEGPLKEAAEQSKKSWQGFTEGMQASMAEGDSFATALKKNIGGIGGAIGGMGKAIMGALLNPFTLVLVAVGALVFLLKSAFDELGRLEGMSRDFRLEMGMSQQQIGGIRDMVEDLEGQYKGMGIWGEKFYESAAAWADVNASVDHATKQQIEFVGLLERATGVAAATSTGAMANIMKLGGTARGEAEGLVMEMKTLAQKHGVKYAQVMEDVSAAGEDALIFAKGSAKALALGAVHARRMGSSLEDAASSAEALLDFEGSINAEMQASSMFGRHINMNGLRQAAMAGDVNAMMKERFRIMDSLGGLENMNRWQQQALAEAMGTTVGELMNMNKARKEERMLQAAANAGEEWAVKALARRNAEKAKENMSEIEKLKLLEEQNQQQETMEAMANKFKEVWHNVKTAMLPIVQELAPQIVEFIQSFTGKTGEGTERMDKLKAVIMGVVDAVKWVVENWEGLLWGIGAAIVALKVIPGILSIIAARMAAASAGGAAGPGSSSLFGMNPVAMIKGAAAVAILAGAMWIAAKAFQEFADVNWEDAALGLGTLGALAIAAKYLGKAGPEILKGAGAIFLLGLALIPAAYAFQMFADISWTGVFIGIGALALLAVVAGILGAPPIIGFVLMGALAIAALGLAMIPFAIAAVIAAYALEIVAGSMMTMVKALQELTFKDIGKLTLLALAGPLLLVGGVMAGIGLGAMGIGLGILGGALWLVMTPLDMFMTAIGKLASVLGGVVVGIINAIAAAFGTVGDAIEGVLSSVAEIIESIGASIAEVLTAIGEVVTGIITSIAEGIALVIDSVSAGITAMVDDIARLAELDAGNLWAVASGIVAISGAMASFGVGSAVGKAADAGGNLLSAGLNLGASLLGGGDTEELNKSPLQKLLDFAAEADNIIAVADKMDLLLNSFDRLADMEGNLESVADTLGVVGHAIGHFASTLGKLSGEDTGWSLGSLISSIKGEEKESPMDTFIGFLDQLSSIAFDGTQIESLVTSITTLGGMNETMLASADAMGTLGDALYSFGAGLGKIAGAGKEKMSLWDRVFGGDDKEEEKGPMEQLLDFIGKLSMLETVTPQLDSLVSSLDQLASMTDSLVASADALYTLGDAFEAFGAGLSRTSGEAPKKSGGIFGWFNLFDDVEPEKQQGPMEQMLAFLDQLSSLGDVGVQMDTLVGSLERLGGMSEMLQSSAEGIRSMGGALMMFSHAIASLSMAQNVQTGGGISGWLSGLFGAEETEKEDPLDQLFGFIDRLAGIQVNTEVLELLSNLNIGGILHGMPDDFGDKLHLTTAGLTPFLAIFDNLKSSTAGNMEKISHSITRLMTGLAKSLPLLKSTSTKSLKDLAVGLEDFFDSISGMRVSKVQILPEVGSAIQSLSIGLSHTSSIPSDVASKLNALGYGLHEFFDELGGFDTEPISKLGAIQASLFPFIDSIIKLNIASIPANIDELLNNLGVGLHEFFDELSGFEPEGLEKLATMTATLTPVLNIAKLATDGESSGKIMEFASMFVDAMNVFAGVEDPAIQALKAINAELGALTNTVEKLDMQKLGELKNLGAKGVKGPTGAEGPAGVSGSVGDLTERAKREIEREEQFRKVYTTPEEISKKIERQQTFLAEEIARVAGDPLATKRIQHGVGLVQQDISILEKIKSDMQPTTPTLAEIFAKPVTEPISTELAQTSAIPTIEESIGTQLQEVDSGASSSMLSRVADFASGMIPDVSKLLEWLDFSEPEFEQSVNADRDFGEFESIYIRGESVFVEEIAKLGKPVSQTPAEEQKEESEKVVKKLDELIKLMQNGGIAVNMDGRKVSKSVAKVHD